VILVKRVSLKVASLLDGFRRDKWYGCDRDIAGSWPYSADADRQSWSSNLTHGQATLNVVKPLLSVQQRGSIELACMPLPGGSSLRKSKGPGADPTKSAGAACFYNRTCSRVVHLYFRGLG
jgi:hypothetical protein